MAFNECVICDKRVFVATENARVKNWVCRKCEKENEAVFND